jgi:hypothetical protein
MPDTMSTFAVIELYRRKTRTRIHIFKVYYTSDEDTLMDDLIEEASSLGPDWGGEMHIVPEETFTLLMREKGVEHYS